MPGLSSDQFYRLLRRARWMVPLALTVLVLLFEAYEHGVRPIFPHAARYGFQVDFLFFGVVGPIVVGLALHWMGSVFHRLQRSQIERDRLYTELQAKEQARRRLLEAVINAQEEERKRVARDLHDGVSQALTAFVLASEGLTLDDPSQASRLRLARQSAQQALDAIRALIPDLRPPLLDRQGLVPTLQSYVDDLFSQDGPQVRWQIEGTPRRLEPALELAVFRIAQEALSNVYRHARARQVVLRLDFQPRRLVLVIQDDGAGFDPRSVRPGPRDLRGVGLLGMEERASMVNGHLHLESAPGRGTRVELTVPLDGEAHG